MLARLEPRNTRYYYDGAFNPVHFCCSVRGSFIDCLHLYVAESQDRYYHSEKKSFKSSLSLLKYEDFGFRVSSDLGWIIAESYGRSLRYDLEYIQSDIMQWV